MATVTKVIDAPRERVWAVLANGWSYASWVVGAAHIRAVDAGWPAPGASIHHSVAPWPLTIEDVTVVRAARPGESLELDAKAWPLGAARVRLELDSIDSSNTKIQMSEWIEHGAGRFLPSKLQVALLVARNRESLDRLGDLSRGDGPM
ncbi:SRPBCC family protein [Actinokineospora iranica]|uniref:Polyketide cyclase / dehydrase and lipid transport n=1 Tax=Actinokineospora iranica TaxID=1271860 RepID=A0A1G6WJ21_9PSEU|nr:SRPBCC family protein [Actinokineospora iranica]SDD65703.1 Polyketide cyclase / dehydrase and lipid transport [Actinokineospora iranica]